MEPITIASVSIAVCSLLYQVYRESHADEKEEIEKLKVDIAALKNMVVALDTKIGPFWISLQAKLTDAMTRPTHVEMDGLLKKLQQMTITTPERFELKQMLTKSIVDPENTPEFRQMAQVLIVAMDLVLQEEAGTLTTTQPGKSGDSPAAIASKDGA